jgi:hypothetical protein
VAGRCRCQVRLVFFLSFSSADHSLLSDPPPLRLTLPSPCVALTFATCRPCLHHMLPSPHPVAFAASPRAALASSCRLCCVASSPRITLTTLPLSRHPVASHLLRDPLATRPPFAMRHPRRAACSVAPSPRVTLTMLPPSRRPPRHASPLRHASPSSCRMQICGGNGREVVGGWVVGRSLIIMCSILYILSNNLMIHILSE